MSTSHVSSGDILFHYGEAAFTMMILKKGKLRYFIGEQQLEVQPGTCISEGSLWTRWIHRGMLAAVEETTILVLDAEQFQSIVSTFEIATKSDPAEYAQEFVAMLNANEDDLTDLPLCKGACALQRSPSSVGGHKVKW